jgi:hypothetical protein
MILATVEAFNLPAIQGVPGPKRRYRLTDDYRFEWEENGKRYARTVYRMDQAAKSETITDLASVPDDGPAGALAGSIGIDNAGPSDGGAAIHDNGYERLGKFLPGEFQVLVGDEWVDCHEPFTRLRCDKLYFKMIRLGGMSLPKACIEFASLRVGAVSIRNGVKWYFS